MASTSTSTSTSTCTPPDNNNKKKNKGASSKFNNSPVFDYLSTLSPIQPPNSNTNTTLIYHTFNSPTSPSPSPSPSSLFNYSPLPPHSLPHSPFSLTTTTTTHDQSHQSNLNASHTLLQPLHFLTPGGSLIKAARPNDSHFKTHLDQTLHRDFMDHYLTHTTPSPVPDNYVRERKPLFQNELHFHQNDWLTSTPQLAADHVIECSSIFHENMEGNYQKSVGPEAVSLLSTFPDRAESNSNSDDINIKIIKSQDIFNSSNQNVTESEEKCSMNTTDQTTAILSGNLVDDLVVNDPTTEVAAEQQSRVRRRCLFELPGACKKKLIRSCSTLLPSGSKVDYSEAHLKPNKTDNYKPSMFSGNGLHLNELATDSKDDMRVYNENQPTGIQLMNTSGSSNSYVYGQFSQTSFNQYLHSNSMAIISDDEKEAAEVVGNESDQNSPEKKRPKFEDVGASQACKRCNCRRSKCLKLYCECFAAGLYCIEPCSCHDCLNKPAHVDTVLETRKLIESRNPIAFAPKVMRSTATFSESGAETNKTPASARHKRGCNCKKSSCLKKYCECFQGGVGCCASCRCEGCRNKFGRKTDAKDIVFEAETEDRDARRSESDASSYETIARNVEDESQNLLTIASELSRSPDQKRHTIDGNLEGSFFSLPSSGLKLNRSKSMGSEPHYKVHLKAITEDEISRNDGPPPTCSTTKTGSPNSKRISPPHPALHSNRKLGLRSIRLFPSLDPS